MSASCMGHGHRKGWNAQIETAFLTQTWAFACETICECIGLGSKEKSPTEAALFAFLHFGWLAVDWSKLISRPATFDYKTMDEDLKNFKDWLWQLTQYLITVDEMRQTYVPWVMTPSRWTWVQHQQKPVRGQPSSTAFGQFGQESGFGDHKSSSCRDGFEALRQLTISMRPNIQSRGLALVTSVTAWPGFSMNKSLQTQLLRLEKAFDETRKAGTPLADELKTAILLRCISGSLETHLNLNMKDGTKYLEVREEVLRWDRAQQKWNGVSPVVEESHEAVAMEIDRVEGKGKGGKKGKERTKVEPKANQDERKRQRWQSKRWQKRQRQVIKFSGQRKAERLQTSLAMYAVKLDTLQRTAGMVECAMWHQVWLQVQHHQTGPILQACHNRDKRSNRMRNRH